MNSRSITLFALSIVCLSFGCKDNPAKPENHRPVVISLSASPDTIGVSDSSIIICNATDPDADTLVYDWITDGRVIIAGANPGENALYNTFQNSRVIYPKNINNGHPLDTLWVQCFARDRRGKDDNRVVRVFLRRP